MRDRVVLAVGVLSALSGMSAIGLSLAGAQTEVNPHPPAITTYADYPLGLGIVPPSCTTPAPATLQGVQFSIDGGPPVANLATFTTPQVTAGSRLTMTWTGFAPGCEGIGVGLSGKIAQQPFFDPATNQHAQYIGYCGPGGNPCVAPFQLSISLNPPIDVPCYQIDAHLGPQLDVVGPAGAFYTNAQFNMLISANNGGTEPCDVPPCPTNPAIPIAALSCTTTTTSPPSVAPTTEAPPSPRPTTPVSVLPTIAVTGRSGGPLASAGGVLLATGVALAAVAFWIRGTGGRRSAAGGPGTSRPEG